MGTHAAQTTSQKPAPPAPRGKWVKEKFVRAPPAGYSGRGKWVKGKFLSRSEQYKQFMAELASRKKDELETRKKEVKDMRDRHAESQQELKKLKEEENQETKELQEFWEDWRTWRTKKSKPVVKPSTEEKPLTEGECDALWAASATEAIVQKTDTSKPEVKPLTEDDLWAATEAIVK